MNSLICYFVLFYLKMFVKRTFSQLDIHHFSCDISQVCHLISNPEIKYQKATFYRKDQAFYINFGYGKIWNKKRQTSNFGGKDRLEFVKKKGRMATPQDSSFFLNIETTIEDRNVVRKDMIQSDLNFTLLN